MFKYRKGACQNCGALTHDQKTCTERPRKVGAKYSNRNFANDEIIQEQNQILSKLSYEAKRDRWNGYDPSSYKQVTDEWNEINEAERKLKEKLLQEKLQKKALKAQEARDSFDESDSSSDDEDPDKEREGAAGSGVAVDDDPRKRTMNRNLRIREDTAKYLRNLDPNSAAYSGKSRTMNDNPNPDLPMSQQIFKGDNMAKFSGDFLSYLN